MEMSHEITSKKCGRECQCELPLMARDTAMHGKRQSFVCAKWKPWSLLCTLTINYHGIKVPDLVIIIFHISHCLHNCYHCLTCARHSNACRSCDLIQTLPNRNREWFSSQLGRDANCWIDAILCGEILCESLFWVEKFEIQKRSVQIVTKKSLLPFQWCIFRIADSRHFYFFATFIGRSTTDWTSC